MGVFFLMGLWWWCW